MLRKLYTVKKKELQMHMALVAGIFVIGIIGDILLYVNNRNEEVGILQLLIIGVFLEFWSAATAKCDYNISISMGNTRKNCIISEIFLVLFETIVLLSLICISHMIHLEISGDSAKNKFMSTFLKPEYVFLGIMGFTAMISFVKFLIIRFENKAVIGIWVFYMALCMIITRLVHITDEKNNSTMTSALKKFVSTLKDIDKNEWFAVVTVITILLFALSGYLGMKTEVSN